jgi:hypothetical protein
MLPADPLSRHGIFGRFAGGRQIGIQQGVENFICIGGLGKVIESAQFHGYHR